MCVFEYYKIMHIPTRYNRHQGGICLLSKVEHLCWDSEWQPKREREGEGERETERETERQRERQREKEWEKG